MEAAAALFVADDCVLLLVLVPVCVATGLADVDLCSTDTSETTSGIKKDRKKN
jgi:hypothetical protein